MTDLLIIGAGTLGCEVAKQWLANDSGAIIVAETRTGSRHAQLREQGMHVRLRSDAEPRPAKALLFAVPPSQCENYQAEAARAARLCESGGALAMVSSTAVYAENAGGICTEASELADSPRALRLHDAEQKIQKAGGMILRMSGLYNAERGPHNVFLQRANMAKHGEGLLNLIHYSDAANLCIAALQKGEAGCVYMGADGSPLTRQMLRAAALRWAGQSDANNETFFSGTETERGRRCDTRWTREMLGWQPKCESVQHFFEQAGFALPS